MADFEVNVILRAQDQARSAVQGLRGELQSLQSLQKRSGAGKRGGFFGAANLASAASGVQQLTHMTRAAIQAPIELAANFEHAIKRVDAFSGGVLSLEGNLIHVEEKARDLGRTTEFTATDAADAFAVLTQAGFTYEQQMASVGTVLDVATAGQIEMSKAADIVAGAIGGFNKDASESIDIANVMAKTATKTQTDIVGIGQAFKVVAPASDVLGISLRDTAAALGVLGKARIRGGEAGTALRAIFGRIASPTTGNAKKALRAMGISRKKFREAMEGENPLQGTLQILEQKLARFSVTRKETLLKALFGERRWAQAALLIRSVSKESQGTERSLKFFQDELVNTDGALDKMAQTMRSGTKAKGQELKSALEELGITIGTELFPVLNPLIQDAKEAAVDFADWAKKNKPLVQSLGKMAIGLVAVGSVLGPLLLTLSAFRSIIGLGSGMVGLLGRNMLIASGNGKQLTGTLGALNRVSVAGQAGLIGYAAGVALINREYAKLRGFEFDLGEGFIKGHDVDTAQSQVRVLDKQIAADQAVLRKEKGELKAYEDDWLEWDYMKKRRLEQNVERTEEGLEAKLTARKRLQEEVLDPALEKRDADYTKRQRQMTPNWVFDPKTGVFGASEGQGPQLENAKRMAPNNALVDSMATNAVDVGGSIKIEVDDKRTRIVDVKSGDIPIEVDGGMMGME
jgi:TP901 family phage tail tape measure protein